MNELFSNIAKGYIDAGFKVLESIEVGAEGNISLGSGETEISTEISTDAKVSSGAVDQAESTGDDNKVDGDGDGSASAEAEESSDSDNGVSLGVKIDFTPLVQEAVEGLENAIKHRMGQKEDHQRDVNQPELNDGSFDAMDVETNNAPEDSVKSKIIHLFNKGGVIDVADIRPALNKIIKNQPPEEQRATVGGLRPLQEINLDNFKALLSEEQRAALEDPNGMPGHNRGFVRFAKDRDGRLKLETYGTHRCSCWLNNRINVTQGHNREMRMLFANSLMKDWGSLTEQREGADVIKHSTLGRILRETRARILGAGHGDAQPDQIQLLDTKFGEALSLDEMALTIKEFEAAFSEENKTKIAQELLAHCAANLGVAVNSTADLDKFLKTFGKDLLALEGPNQRRLANSPLLTAFANGCTGVIACFKSAANGAAVKTLMEDTLQFFMQLRLRYVYDQNVDRMIEGYSRNPSVDLQLTTKPGQAESHLLSQIRTSLSNHLTTLPPGSRPTGDQLNLFMNKVLPQLVKSRLEPLQTLQAGPKVAAAKGTDVPSASEPKVEGEAQPVDLEALSRETLRADVKSSLSLAKLWEDFQSFAAESASWKTGNFNFDGLDVLIEVKTEEADLLKKRIEKLGRQLPQLIDTAQFTSTGNEIAKLSDQLTKLQNEISYLKDEQAKLGNENVLGEKAPELQHQLEKVKDAPAPGKQSLARIVRDGFSINVQAEVVEDYRVHNYLMGKYGIRTALPDSLKVSVKSSAENATQTISQALQQSGTDKKTNKNLGSYFSEIADFLFGDTAQELISTNVEISNQKPGNDGSKKTVSQITQTLMESIGNELSKTVLDTSANKEALTATLKNSVLLLSWRMSSALLKFKNSDLATFGRSFESYLSIYENHHKVGEENGPTAAKLMTDFRQMVKTCLSEAVQGFYNEDLRGLLFINDLTKLQAAFDARFGLRMRMAVEKAEQRAINDFYARILGFDYGDEQVNVQRGIGRDHSQGAGYAQLAPMVGVQYNSCIAVAIPLERAQQNTEIAPGLKVSEMLVEKSRKKQPTLGLSTQEIVNELNKKVADAWCVEVFENQQDRYNIVVEKLFGHKIRQLGKKNLLVDDEWARERAVKCQDRMRTLLDDYVAFEQQFLGAARTAVRKLLDGDAAFQQETKNQDAVVDAVLSSLRESIQKALLGFFQAPDQYKALCRNVVTEALNSVATRVSIREWQTKDMTTFVIDALRLRADGLVPDAGTTVLNTRLNEVKKEATTKIADKLENVQFREGVMAKTVSDITFKLPDDETLKKQILDLAWKHAAGLAKDAPYTQFVGLSDEELRDLVVQYVKADLAVLATPSSLKGLTDGVNKLDEAATEFLKDYPNLADDLATRLTAAKEKFVEAYLDACAQKTQFDSVAAVEEFTVQLDAVRKQETSIQNTLVKYLEQDFNASVEGWKKQLEEIGVAGQKVSLDSSEGQLLVDKLTTQETTIAELLEQKARKMLETFNSEIAVRVHDKVSFESTAQDIAIGTMNTQVIAEFKERCESFWSGGLKRLVETFDPSQVTADLARCLGVDEKNAVLNAVLTGNASVAGMSELNDPLEAARTAYLKDLAAVMKSALADVSPKTKVSEADFSETRKHLAKLTAYVAAKKQVEEALKSLNADETFGKLQAGTDRETVLNKFTKSTEELLTTMLAEGAGYADTFARQLKMSLDIAVMNARPYLKIQNLNAWLLDGGTAKIVELFKKSNDYNRLLEVQIKDADTGNGRTVSVVLSETVGNVVRDFVKSDRYTLEGVRNLLAEPANPEEIGTFLKLIAEHQNVRGTFDLAKEALVQNDKKAKFELERDKWIQNQVNQVFFQLGARVLKTPEDKVRFARDTGKEIGKATVDDVFTWIKAYLPQDELAGKFMSYYLAAVDEVRGEIYSFCKPYKLNYSEASQDFRQYVAGQKLDPVKTIYGLALGEDGYMVSLEEHKHLSLFDGLILTAYETMNGRVQMQQKSLSDQIESVMNNALDTWFTKDGDAWKVFEMLNRIETSVSGDRISRESTIYFAAQGVVQKAIEEVKRDVFAKVDAKKDVVVTDEMKREWRNLALKRLKEFLAKGMDRIKKYDLNFNSPSAEIANFKACLIAAYEADPTQINMKALSEEPNFDTVIMRMKDDMQNARNNDIFKNNNSFEETVYGKWLHQVDCMREACFVLDERAEHVLENVQKIRANAATNFDLITKFTQIRLLEMFDAEASKFRQKLDEQMRQRSAMSVSTGYYLPDPVKKAFTERYERVLSDNRPQLKKRLDAKTDKANDIGNPYVNMFTDMEDLVVAELDGYIKNVRALIPWARRAAFQQFYAAVWPKTGTMTDEEVVKKLKDVLKANKVELKSEQNVNDISPAEFFGAIISQVPGFPNADKISFALVRLQTQIETAIVDEVYNSAWRMGEEKFNGALLPLPVVDRTNLPGFNKDFDKRKESVDIAKQKVGSQFDVFKLMDYYFKDDKLRQKYTYVEQNQSTPEDKLREFKKAWSDVARSLGKSIKTK